MKGQNTFEQGGTVGLLMRVETRKLRKSSGDLKKKLRSYAKRETVFRPSKPTSTRQSTKYKNSPH